MKKNLTFSLVILITGSFSSLFGQGVDKPLKSLLYISTGKAIHTDMTIGEKEFYIGLNYQRQFNRRFAWEVSLTRASANSTIDFFQDGQRVVQLLNSLSFSPIGIDWSRITTYSLGVKGHYFFISNKRHRFSLNGGLGYYTSKSSIQGFTSFTTNLENGEILEVTTQEGEETVNDPFLTFGLQYNYTFKNDISLGLGVTGFFDQSSQSSVLTQPVLANYFGFGITVGKRF